MSHTQPSIVKPHYPISIYVVGPSSTGKTTLCRALAQRLGLHGSAYVAEVARHVMRTHGFTRKHVGKLEMQRAILDAQLLREEEGLENHIQICDRSGIDPIVYAKLSASDSKQAYERQQALVNLPSFQRALERYRHPNSLFILLAPVSEWLVDDGVRSIENQVECWHIFKETLAHLGIGYTDLGADVKSLAERVSLVMGLTRLLTKDFQTYITRNGESNVSITTLHSG